MNISVHDATGRLTDLVARAEAGEEVVLTRDGQAAVRLVPVSRLPAVDRAARRALIEAVQASAAKKLTPGPSAARSQDFLYDEDGLPA